MHDDQHRGRDDATRFPGDLRPTIESDGRAGPPPAVGSGPARPVDELVGGSIGQYRLLGVLGRGGMGVVYEAEQQQPRRRVALKVISGRHHADEFHVRMFHREAEMLGRLRHGHIAAIYESGHTVDGRHYFAMELVRGETLDRHVERLDPGDLEARLRLFLTICDAVGYAHQRGVIHRDLKPANIMVQDGDVKVLDFGLARIMDPEDEDAVMLTQVGAVKGTPAYMSPEQAGGDPDELDLRSDVYSLGVILYELLSGALPLDVTGSSVLDALRVVRDDEPRPLRRASPAAGRIPLDLETVVHKALAKDRDRRYQSAGELAQDIQRFLDHEPVLAVPPGAAYRLGKLVRRHRTVVSALAAILLVLVGATVVSTTQYVAAERESARARIEAHKSEQIAGFLTDMLRGVGPGVARGRDTGLLREVLDRTSERIGEELADQPEVEASLRSVLGATYRELGEYGAAEPQLETALAIHRRSRGVDAAASLEASAELAGLRYHQGRMAEADSLFRWTIGRLVATVGEQDRRTLAARVGLVLVLTYLGELDEAAALGESVLPPLLAQEGGESEIVQTAMYHLAQTYADQLRFDAADSLYVELTGILERELGDEHPRTLNAHVAHGWLHRIAGRLDEAERLTGPALADLRRVLGDEHAETLIAVNNLAIIYKDQGRFVEAEPLYLESLEAGVRLLGETHPENLPGMVNLAAFYETQGRWQDVHRLADRAVTLFQDVMPAGHVGVALARMMRGYGAIELGRPVSAEADLLTAEAALASYFGPEHRTVLRLRRTLGELYASQGRTEEAGRWRTLAGEG